MFSTLLVFAIAITTATVGAAPAPSAAIIDVEERAPIPSAAVIIERAPAPSAAVVIDIEERAAVCLSSNIQSKSDTITNDLLRQPPPPSLPAVAQSTHPKDVPISPSSPTPAQASPEG
jgi:hypothetical protein